MTVNATFDCLKAASGQGARRTPRHQPTVFSTKCKGWVGTHQRTLPLNDITEYTLYAIQGITYHPGQTTAGQIASKSGRENQPEIQGKECSDRWKSLSACRLKVVYGQKARTAVAGIGRIAWLRAIIRTLSGRFVLNWIQFKQPHEVLTQLMWVQIGNPLFWIAYFVLRIAEGKAERPRFSCLIVRQSPGFKRDSFWKHFWGG